MTSKNIYMQRALELAQLGKGHVSPNPMVGCVIVHQGNIIGEGYHQKYGEAHAEVNAINSVTQKELLSEAEVYVSLEPCSHHGKTPPCVDLLIKHQVRKVVVANTDPNPLVSGSGINKLKDAGISVERGVLEIEGSELNRRFFKAISSERPYIIFKWAQTGDGFIARENFDSKWISDEYSRKMVHQWRTEEDAILVGTNTARYDNPKLNVRDWVGRNPARIVIDKHLKLDTDLNLFDRSQQTICYNLKQTKSSKNLDFVKLDDEGFLESMMKDIHERGIHSIIVEGGAATINAFIAKNLWDEARVFMSDKSFGGGIAAPALKGTLVSSKKLVNDQLNIYRNNG